MKIVLIIILAIVVLLVAVYAYFGGFSPVKVSTNTEGGETIVYKEIKGEYRKSGAAMDEVYYHLKEKENLDTYKGIGIYYDNPQKVAKEDLRSEAGCVIEPADLDKLSALPADFKTKVLPAKEYIVAQFPYKGKISVMFSIMKVYPALNKFAEENGCKVDTYVMEIYDIPNKKICYRKELQKKE